MIRCTASQAMHPSGLRGRLLAVLMERLNFLAYKRAVALIAPAPGDTILEIGFGTGALLSMLAPHVSARRRWLVGSYNGESGVVMFLGRASYAFAQSARLHFF